MHHLQTAPSFLAGLTVSWDPEILNTLEFVVSITTTQ